MQTICCAADLQGIIQQAVPTAAAAEGCCCVVEPNGKSNAYK
jgi:hypothetical protein